MNDTIRLRLAGISGFIAVALGAFGAHALEPFLLENNVLDTWNTAVLYHLVHTAAMLVPAAGGKRLPPALFFALGLLFFSGSLYVLCLSGLKFLGAVTPLGGVFFLAGWGRLALQSSSPGPGGTT
ncbi:MAG: DUF423 domain-containing protein [Acidobacteriota bacterium]|nr:DUF423 domain-containing protein [Acidobacteriota bacterium]